MSDYLWLAAPGVEVGPPPVVDKLEFAPLIEYLREWRREVAKENKSATFMVMHDASLDALCRIRPQTLTALQKVHGFGERKAEVYGQQILDALERFRNGARASTAETPKTRPAEETLHLLAEGNNFEQIAKIRGRQISSVIGMVADLVEKGQLEFQPAWVEETRRVMIEAACASLGLQWLKPLKEALPPEITHDEIRLVVARMRREQAQLSPEAKFA